MPGVYSRAWDRRRLHKRPGVHEGNAEHLRVECRRHEAFHARAWNADGTRQKTFHNSGGDALRGDTRSHPEHDG